MSKRYVDRQMNGYKYPGVWDSERGVWHKLPGRPTWSDARHTAERWNAGELTPSEACTIVEAFFRVAVWADAPEGSRPRPTNEAWMTARKMVDEFVTSVGTPLFRAALDAYVKHGLHPDCLGDACNAFGHDLYLTLEGHGAGFWDRDALAEGEPSIGGELTDKCHRFRWRDPHGSGRLEFYRGWIRYREPTQGA